MKTRILLLALSLSLTSCSQSQHQFEMTIDKVELLQGLILKGLALSGTVTQGCIANDDWFIVYRNGKKVTTADTRLLLISNLKEGETFNGEADVGDHASFYIPDGKTGDIVVGDVLVSNDVSCEQNNNPSSLTE